MSAAIIAQAEAERANYGDEAFFKRLNPGQGGEQQWERLGRVGSGLGRRVVRGRRRRRRQTPNRTCAW